MPVVTSGDLAFLGKRRFGPGNASGVQRKIGLHSPANNS